MHLLNAAVAVASALVGTVGATVAYGTLNTTPTVIQEPRVEPVTLTHYLPCEPPAKLTDGVCLTTLVKTVVKTVEPKVITVVERSRPTKSNSNTPSTSTARNSDDDDHEDEDDHEDKDEDEDDHGDEDEHED